MAGLYDLEATSIDGEEVALSRYAGNVSLVVNVASECGLTPQYAGLQDLQARLHGRGFNVLAFPCNQFGGQEPGSNDEVCAFVQKKFGAEFPMFAKIEVNGPGTHPVYRFLKTGHPGDEGQEDIAWNFAKFLVDRKGNVVKRWSPKAAPEEIAGEIEAAL